MTSSVHLVQQFQPEHYDIRLDISREAKKINGTVIVQGNASENQLLLNQKFLKILTVTENGQSRAFVTDDETELLQVTLDHSGPVSLTISYTTQLTDTDDGDLSFLLRSKWPEETTGGDAIRSNRHSASISLCR